MDLNISKDLRFSNIRLHSRGKTESGTLYLTRYHLIFSYVPMSGPVGSDNVSRNGSSLDGNGRNESNAKQSSAGKVKPKEIWVPYSLVNHCALRSSHSQAQATHVDDVAHAVNREGTFDDSAFPPVYGTSAYERPSTDSAHLAPHAISQRASSAGLENSNNTLVVDSGRSPAIRLRRRDFTMLAFHFHPSSTDRTPDNAAREAFYSLRSRCVVEKVQHMHAFHFKAPQEEEATDSHCYDARQEFARMGIGGKAAEGPGSAWRISHINRDYQYSATYPSVLCVPQAVSDNMLKYGGAFRSKSRIPTLTYLHTNGGSITRSSQPMVGLQNKRSPQDERLLSAIFSSHLPVLQAPSDRLSQQIEIAAELTDADSDRGTSITPQSQHDPAVAAETPDNDIESENRVYGSTRRSLIFDARPKMNAYANRTTGGGMEDVSNYSGPPGTIVERKYLNIANIHVMRKSLDKVIESLANSDYLDMKPNQELLRNSGWLGHISIMLESAVSTAKAVGLGGSHVLVHCSDGWDRTAQVAALAQIMLDPYYRTLRGFVTLVQKDFLSFGHKFNHRSGIQGSEKWFETENEKVMPSRAKDSDSPDPAGLNAFGSKALAGAKNWFDKSRGNLFRQQNEGKSEDGSDSHPPSPPSNTLVHSVATANTKEDRELKTDLKEIAPVFHQFLDAVFQMQYQNPNAFEFNERFLRRLFYQVYSGQYGEFLFNTEKDRTMNESKFCSVWPHFLSRKEEFTNPHYVSRADDLLLFPRLRPSDDKVDVRWWSSLFGRKNEDMNTLVGLAPPDPEPIPDVPKLNMQTSSASLDDKSLNASSSQHKAADRSTLDQSVSAPEADPITNEQNSRPVLEQAGLDHRNAPKEQPSPVKSEEAESRGPISSEALDTGDPLGVSTHVPVTTVNKLDSAAFARLSAFSER